MARKKVLCIYGGSSNDKKMLRVLQCWKVRIYSVGLKIWMSTVHSLITKVGEIAINWISSCKYEINAALYNTTKCILFYSSGRRPDCRIVAFFCVHQNLKLLSKHVTQHTGNSHFRITLPILFRLHQCILIVIYTYVTWNNPMTYLVWSFYHLISIKFFLILEMNIVLYSMHRNNL